MSFLQGADPLGGPRGGPRGPKEGGGKGTGPKGTYKCSLIILVINSNTKAALTTKRLACESSVELVLSFWQFSPEPES